MKIYKTFFCKINGKACRVFPIIKKEYQKFFDQHDLLVEKPSKREKQRRTENKHKSWKYDF